MPYMIAVSLEMSDEPYFYSFSIMANALWRTSTNMSQFINITFTFYTFITAMFI